MAATLGKRTFSELFAEDEPADVGYFVDDFSSRSAWGFYQEHEAFTGSAPAPEATTDHASESSGLPVFDDAHFDDLHGYVDEAATLEPATFELVWMPDPPASALHNGDASSDAEEVAAVDIEGWTSGVVQSLARVTTEDEIEWCAYVEHTYGSPLGRSGAKKAQVKKLILVDRLLIALIGQGVVVNLNALDEYEEGGNLHRVLRPGRSWSVPEHLCLAFNKAFRALQDQHLDWPRNRAVITETKGITQPLSALGMGPPVMGPWTGRKKGLRGPEEDDPEKTWDEGRKGFVAKKGKRDGLYYTSYVFSEERARKNADHVFDQ
jgi:hypothetical protein